MCGRVRRIQGETFREDLEQAGVVGFGMLEHRGVRLQEDVNGRDRRLGWRRLSQLRMGAHGGQRQEARECSFHQELGKVFHGSCLLPSLVIVDAQG